MRRSNRRRFALGACVLTVLAGIHPVSAAPRARLTPGAPVPAPAAAPAPTPAAAAARTGTDGLPGAAKEQIASLLAEKDSRTPAQRKIDSNLLYAIKQSRGERVSDLVPSLATGVASKTGDGRVVVDIVAHIGGTLYEDIVGGGGDVQSVYPEYNSMRALVRLDQIESIAAREDVVFVGPEQKSMTQAAAVAPAARPGAASTGVGAAFADRAARVRASLAAALPRLRDRAGKVNVGSAQSEGDATHGANTARSTHLSDGAGIKVGVLSDGVASLAASQALGDLGPVTVLPGQVGSGDEGTAMLEIVHDLAPKAKLFFAAAGPTVATFAANVRDLRNTYGCDIIVDDTHFFVETPFQDGQSPNVVSNTNGGLVTQAVKDVTANGGMYFSAAGDQGNKDDGTSSCYQSDFVDGGTLAGLSDGTVHDFGGGAQSDLIQTGSGNPIDLYWADPLGGSTNDYDLFVFDDTLTTVVASSTNVQDGTVDPFEEVAGFANATNNRIVVLKKTGATNRFFYLTSNGNRDGFGGLGTSTEGATKGHGMAAAAFSVGATPATSPGPYPGLFTGSNTTETFSSDGPRRIFFNGNGSPFTPGNFSSTGGVLRQKPDITAADGVSVSGVGGFSSPFYGTSAAAPHAAAIAALIYSADINLSPSDIRSLMTSTAIDIEASGVDRDSGAGIVMPVPALQADGATPGPLFDLGTVTATEVGGNGDTDIDPGESGQLTVQLTNDGEPATGITTTLLNFTPGVHVTSASSAYPDIGTGGSGTNATPFAFNLDSNVACDLTIQFGLVIDYPGGAERLVQIDLTVGRPPITITDTLDATPPAASADYTAVTGTQTDRVRRDGIASTCSLPKPECPGVFSAPTPRYDAYTFSACATGAAQRCITVRLSTPCPTVADATELFSVAYADSYDPTDVCANYLADPGIGTVNGEISYTFTVAAGETFVVVVNEIPGIAPADCPYTLTVSGLCTMCPVDVPTVAFSTNDYTATEGDGTANLVLNRTGNTTGSSTVRVSDLGGDATPGDDYTFTSPTSVTFGPGETTKMVPIGIVDDSDYEPDGEVVSFRVINLSNAAIVSPSITNLTILDNEPDPVVEFSSATFSANESTGMGTVTLTRTGDTTQTAAVTVTVTGGTATPDSDFQNSFPRNVFFAPGDATTTMDFQIIDDTEYEPGADETITFAVAALSHAAIGAQDTTTFSIVDNDAPPPVVAFSSATFSASEGAGNGSLTLTRTGSTTGVSQVTVNRVAGGTATPGDDFQDTFPRLVTFNAGETTATVQFVLVDDLLFEPGPGETIDFALSSPVGATIGAQSTATFTIVENDTLPTVTFGLPNYQVNENAGTATLTLTRTGATAGSSTVGVTVTGGTATIGDDYTFASPTAVTFNPNETSKNVSVTIVDDSIYEPGPNETITFEISGASGAQIGTPSTTTLGIVDNDLAPSVQFGSATFSVGEGAGNATLTLTRTGDTSNASTVAVSATGGTANGGGADYTFTSANVTFAASETSKTVSIPIVDDSLYEPGANETVTFSVSNVVGATIGAQSTTTLSIVDNDSAPSVTLAGGGPVSESGGPVTISASLSNPSTQSVTVTLGFSGTATIGPGNDYTASSNTITIPANGIQGNITLTIDDDTSPEGDETIVVDITGVTNGTEQGTQQQIVTITDNDCAIVCPANVSVPASGTSCAATVNYALPTTTGSCGTVTCTPASGSSFPVGVTTVTCTSTAGPSCSFTVTVNDVLPPTITCPSNMTATATGPSGATVTYTTPGAFDFCSTATVVCMPASGSTFPIGVTTVTCTATDGSSNSSSCTFTVTVNAQTPLGDSVGVYVSGGNAWFLRNSNTSGNADLLFNYGGSTTLVALKGDWNDDGVDTPGVYDPASGAFFLRNSNTPGPADITFTFGAAGAGLVPVTGDWDGDGTDTVGVYNPTNGTFFLKNTNASGNADLAFQFGGGGAGIVPVAGDWDGNGTDTIGIYVAASSVFFLKNSNASGAADFAFQFGAAGGGYTPIAGDWNHDGHDSVGIYLPASAAFFLTDTTPGTSADYLFVYGPTSAKPLAGNWDGN